MSTKKNFWIGLPMQMMYGLVLGVIVGTMVSSEFGATYLQPLGQLFPAPGPPENSDHH